MYKNENIITAIIYCLHESGLGSVSRSFYSTFPLVTALTGASVVLFILEIAFYATSDSAIPVYSCEKRHPYRMSLFT